MELKIGNDWVYDTSKLRGSKVIRDESGEVKFLKPEFAMFISTDKAKESRYATDLRNDILKAKFVDFNGEGIPLGVMRKAIEMQLLDAEGKLESLVLGADKSFKEFA